MPTLPLVIIGAGGLGLEIESYLPDSTFHLAGFIDEHRPRGAWGSSQVLGSFQELQEMAAKNPTTIYHYLIAVGDNHARSAMAGRIECLDAENLVAANFHDRSATLGKQVTLAPGSWLAPGAVVAANARLGRHVIVNSRAFVGHDCVIGDFVNIGPGANICGKVQLGEGCYIGAGATVINGKSAGEWSVVAAGATVFTRVPPRVTVMGEPAREMGRLGN